MMTLRRHSLSMLMLLLLVALPALASGSSSRQLLSARGPQRLRRRHLNGLVGDWSKAAKDFSGCVFWCFRFYWFWNVLSRMVLVSFSN